MKLKLVKSFWGMDGTLEENVRRIAEAGFAAVEGQPPAGEDGERLKRLLGEYKLEFIPMVITEGADCDEHLASFRTKLERARTFEPLKITVHGGRDWWPRETQRRFFENALEAASRIGAEVNFETHRGRPLFTPAATASLLREFPELHINADFSHFVNVCESLLEDQTEAMAVCIARSRHVHGRVGHEEGPQVNDPRAPEWARQLAAHEAWWDRIVRARLTAGAECFTFNPEFGPPTYMPTLPYTNQPVADLWAVCLWMARRFEMRYAALVG
jgi:sugar phosphate isomerase/epimerase